MPASPNISIDTRTLKKGDLFIPVKGPNFDGADFIPQALKKGARVLKTKDGLKSLQQIAAAHRAKFCIPLIAVTGSCGKTTTKDMLASILSQEMKTLKNEENFNNEIGVPLTLLKLKPSHKAAVVEMGMQGLGEIKLLADIARPNIVIITNIGEAHLGLLKTRKNIARAKAEILHHLKPGDWAILPRKDEFFAFLKKQVPRGVKIVPFSSHSSPVVSSRLQSSLVSLNAPAVIAAAKILGVKASSIKKGLARFKPSSKRMELAQTRRGASVLNDTYNASPSSMRVALEILAATPNAVRRIAVLGDMLELGKAGKAEHVKIGRFCRQLKIDLFFTIGKLSKAMKADKHFNTNEEAVEHLKKILHKGDVILVKGSRGMRLESVVDALRVEAKS